MVISKSKDKTTAELIYDIMMDELKEIDVFPKLSELSELSEEEKQKISQLYNSSAGSSTKRLIF